MPTYEYECEDCGHRFERLQKMSDRPVTKCPQCSGRVRRLIGTGAAVLVKGSGSQKRRQDAPWCSREQPCCGRDTPCDAPPCGR